jgi:hypothetical protein
MPSSRQSLTLPSKSTTSHLHLQLFFVSEQGPRQTPGGSWPELHLRWDSSAPSASSYTVPSTLARMAMRGRRSSLMAGMRGVIHSCGSHLQGQQPAATVGLQVQHGTQCGSMCGHRRDIMVAAPHMRAVRPWHATSSTMRWVVDGRTSRHEPIHHARPPRLKHAGALAAAPSANCGKPPAARRAPR